MTESSCGGNALCIFRGGASRAGRSLLCGASPPLLRRHGLVRVTMDNGRFFGPSTGRSYIVVDSGLLGPDLGMFRPENVFRPCATQ